MLTEDEMTLLLAEKETATQTTLLESRIWEESIRRRKNCCCGLIPAKEGTGLGGVIWLLLAIFHFTAFHFHQHTLISLGFGSKAIQCFLAMQAAMAVTMTVLLFYALLKETHEQIFTYLIYLAFSTFLYAIVAFILMLYLIAFDGPTFEHLEGIRDLTKAEWKVKEKCEAVQELGWIMFAILSVSIFYGCWFFSLNKQVWHYFRATSLVDMRSACGIPSSFMANSAAPLINSPPSYRVSIPISVFKQQPDLDKVNFPPKNTF